MLACNAMKPIPKIGYDMIYVGFKEYYNVRKIKYARSEVFLKT